MIAYQRNSIAAFPGANSKQLSSNIDVSLKNSNSDRVITYVGINDLLDGSNEAQIDNLIETIGNIIKNNGIKSTFLSGLVLG